MSTDYEMSITPRVCKTCQCVAKLPEDIDGWGKVRVEEGFVYYCESHYATWQKEREEAHRKEDEAAGHEPGTVIRLPFLSYVGGHEMLRDPRKERCDSCRTWMIPNPPCGDPKAKDLAGSCSCCGVAKSYMVC